VGVAGAGSGSPLEVLEIRQLGRALGREPALPSAIGRRDSRFIMMGIGATPTPELAERVHAHLAYVPETMRPFTTGATYVNFLALDEASPERVRTAYSPEDWVRLVALEDRYDPDNLFRFNRNIPPSPGWLYPTLKIDEERRDSMETRQGGVRHVPPGGGRSIWIVGDTYTFKAVSEDTSGAYMLFEGSVPPQSGPPPHIHHWEDEAYYILEGEFEILDNDHTFTASAGSFVYIPRGTLHRFKNVGETTARMLVLFTPGGAENFFFEAGLPAKAGKTAPPLEQEEIERTLALAPKYGWEVMLPKGA
jgi:quercetin dioxygenase-like cupin family protein